MSYQPKRGWIERAAVQLRLLSDLDAHKQCEAPPSTVPLQRYPSPDQWEDVIEQDPQRWPHQDALRHYRLIPTTCFNCESACGLLAYVDKETQTIRKFEGNPLHPGSRGRNCAKGPATINQVNDPDRILTPMKRVGPRGEGRWEKVTWEDALADIGGRIRKALKEERHDEIVYHVGRPGSEGFIDRMLRAWGVDGHNSHTNICSAGARFGYSICWGYDRPAPDYAHARFILAINSHLESGHYFNPHAQRISEALASGAQMAVIDPRLSNTASMAQHWLPARPGTEAALLLAFARIILEEGLFDRPFLEQWTNWRAYLRTFCPDQPETIESFIRSLSRRYDSFTPEFAETECGVPAETVRLIAGEIAAAGSRFCSHTWRGPTAGHVGGWEVARCLLFLHMLTGSVGTEGGTSPAGWHKYKADMINPPPPVDRWNELNWPREYPLAHYEMSFLLPYFLKEGRGKIDVYFTRVFNPVWTYPDGFSWIEALRDESKIGLHVALTPTWNETALWADYVLPMGHGPERHDLTTYETHNATWIAFRQPVLRASLRAEGKEPGDSREANPGQVWEEDEFWITLAWAIDPDGTMGIRAYFESQRRETTETSEDNGAGSGQGNATNESHTIGQTLQCQGEDHDEPLAIKKMLSVDEYYEYIFDRVPGLAQAAMDKGLTPLEYMRRYGAYEVSQKNYQHHQRRLSDDALIGSEVDLDSGVIVKNGSRIGVQIDGVAVEGFPTESRRLEFFSPTLAEWGWKEYAVPGYIRSHIWEGPDDLPDENTDASIPVGAGHGESFCLMPTFRLPTLIHTRSGSAKWLNEISQRNPIWIHTADARRLGVKTGDLVRVTTDIGYFVDRAWVCEAIRPGVIACSHHLGRWRREDDPPASRWSGSVVSIEEMSSGQWRMRRRSGPAPFDSADPDSRRIWWREGGVPQNLTFPVHPDPISGMHCWHQRVSLQKADSGDLPGDVFVDTNKSMAIYRLWLKRCRPEMGPKNLRRPLWMNRPVRPADSAYRRSVAPP